MAEGETVSVTPNGVPALRAVVDYVRPNFLGLRTDDALYRFFGRDTFGGTVGMSIHLFAANADPQQTSDAWQNWLNGAFA